MEQAQNCLYYGYTHGKSGDKISHRWRGDDAVSQLTDYEQLISLLFALRVARNEKFIKDYREGIKTDIPDSPIEIIQKVWRDIIPNRELYFEEGEIIVNKNFNAGQMSDGERVILYLIGQVLCAPERAVIIVDEPEIHIHKSLLYRLWDAIERLCTGRTIIYITHDLEFAASRADAVKIWVKGYSEGRAIWELVPAQEELPETLVLELLGNRKPVLFCEGSRAGKDHAVYKLCYPTFHVVPRGSCKKVIESVKAIRENENLHHFTAFGIVDRDFMTDEEAVGLKALGIEVLEVAEIENLFCLDGVVRLVAKELHRNPEEKSKDSAAIVRQRLQQTMDEQVTLHAERKVRHLMSKYSRLGKGPEGLKQGIEAVLSAIDTEKIFDESKTIFNKVLESNSSEQILRVFNQKNLLKSIADLFNWDRETYIQFVISVMKSSSGEDLISEIRRMLPSFTVG